MRTGVAHIRRSLRRVLIPSSETGRGILPQRGAQPRRVLKNWACSLMRLALADHGIGGSPRFMAPELNRGLAILCILLPPTLARQAVDLVAVVLAREQCALISNHAAARAIFR